MKLKSTSLVSAGLVACAFAFSAAPAGAAPTDDAVMRWWNTLNGEQMVAALHGDNASTPEADSARMMYADLDAATKALVDAAAAEIYGDGGHASVGAWWETLDCRKMRIAAGDGNTADSSSSFCAHYPGSGAAKILYAKPKMFVDVVGQALLGRGKPGVYPAIDVVATRWWNTLNAEQMVAALHGDTATPEQTTAAQKPYADLDADTTALVDAAAAEIYGYGGWFNVGEWWESLDCRKMRVAAGDGNAADSSSPFCAHYPGSGAAKILDAPAMAFVDVVGQAILASSSPGIYPYAATAKRWWNTLNAEQMVAALHGDAATPEEAAAAKMMYADLDPDVRRSVNAVAADLYGGGGWSSVGEWWESLNCLKMRVAAGDGNTVDPSSPFCAHYPGSGAAKILEARPNAFVNLVGQALLGRSDPGVYPSPDVMAMRWWNALNAEQMVAALYGDAATPEEAAAAKMMYADLNGTTKGLVDVAAAAIYGAGGYDSVGRWWETLDCRKMRIAAGDGNTADSSSPFCAHYPGSGAAKILDAASKNFVDTVGEALLGRDDPGMFPPALPMAMRWWNTLNADQMVAALHGDGATPMQATAARRMYADLDDETRGLVNNATYLIYGAGGYSSAGSWWESLDCRKMRIAAGDGNTADPGSPFCAHYPGSGVAKILDAASKNFVDEVGQALLGRKDPGVYPPTTAPDFTTSARCSYGLCRARVGEEVTLKDLSGDGVASREWRIQGGETSSDVSANHSWRAPGFYEVVLAATMRGGAHGTATRTFLVEAAQPQGLCVETGKTRCLRNGRYAARTTLWWSTDGYHGAGNVARAGTNDSVLFGFHGRNNWEILLKVLNGCSVNQSNWNFGAAATDLGYMVEITDTVTGVSRMWRNEAGQTASPLTDSEAFSGVCGDAAAASSAEARSRRDLIPTAATSPSTGAGHCEADSTSLCLRNDRYEVGIDWSTAAGASGTGHVVASQTADSGLFYFFGPQNWEVLVKVLDGCTYNQHHWVFAAAATDVGFTLTVRDKATAASKTYTKEVGGPAPAFVDTAAFPMGCTP